ncbi:MAG: MlaD family protein [Bradymonadia bacterium]
MAVSKGQKARLGVFVTIAVICLLGALVVLAGLRLGESRDPYTVRFGDENVSMSGLDVGSPVKYSGIQIGRVETISVDPEDVSVIVVSLSLNPGTPIAEDSVASLGSLGITGLKYVELTRGSKGARVREPGEVIPAGPSLIDDLTNQAAVISKQVSVVLDRVAAFTSPKMQAQVSSLLSRADKILETYETLGAENRERLRSVLTRTDAIMANAEKVSAELTGTVRRVNALLDDVRPGMHRASSGAARLVNNIERTRQLLDENLEASKRLIENVADLSGPEGAQKTLASLDRLATRSTQLISQARGDLVEAIGYLRETSENMTEFSAKVKDDPSLLLLGEEEEE